MEDSSNKNTGKEIIDVCLHFLVDEYLPRINKCLEYLSEEEIWLKPNDNTPSVGNLLLHLGGNVHQWIIATLGGEQDIRNRTSEFDEKSQPTKSELLEQLTGIINQTKNVLRQLQPDELLKKFHVQAYVETGIRILIHVVEHFSYHLGQITFFVKSRKDIDLGYFSGVNLNNTN